jgi:hypothetical protein
MELGLEIPAFECFKNTDYIGASSFQICPNGD